MSPERRAFNQIKLAIYRQQKTCCHITFDSPQFVVSTISRTSTGKELQHHRWNPPTRIIRSARNKRKHHFTWNQPLQLVGVPDIFPYALSAKVQINQISEYALGRYL